MLCSVLAVLVLLSFNAFFLQIPSPSQFYDCDDAALQTLDKLAGIGVKATPVLGNLKMTGETYSQTDHTWVVVELPFGRELAIDWGEFKIDGQHYEGYRLSREKLVYFVQKDFEGKEIPAEAK